MTPRETIEMALQGEDTSPAMPMEAFERLEAENRALREALKTANANHEKFERLWYLVCDERDALLATLQTIRTFTIQPDLRDIATDAIRGIGATRRARPGFLRR